MSEPISHLVVPPPGHMLDMACRCCGGRRVELVIDLGDQPHCNRLVPLNLPRGVEPAYPLRLGFCRDCTMVQIDHTVPKEAMFSDYPYVSGTTKTLPDHFRRTSERIAASYQVGPTDLVVDVGSNDGTWLAQWAPFGCRVLGVEAMYLGGMVENTAFDQIYHEHLCYYTLRSLVTLLERHGLEVFEAELVPIHGGSIEAHVAHRGRRPVGESVRRL